MAGKSFLYNSLGGVFVNDGIERRGTCIGTVGCGVTLGAGLGTSFGLSVASGCEDSGCGFSCVF